MLSSKVVVKNSNELCPRCYIRARRFYDGYCLNCRITWDLKHDDYLKDCDLDGIMKYLDDKKERAATIKHIPTQWRREVDFDEIKANYHLPF